MDLSNYIQKFSKPIKKQTREQVLAGEIYEWFDKKLNFGMLMKLIQLKGGQWIYECWNETKKSDVDDPLKLFLWKVGQAKITWKE